MYLEQDSDFGRFRLKSSCSRGSSLRSAALFLVACLWPNLVPAQATNPLGHVAVGEFAPRFVADGADGRRHALADYQGKIIVLEWTSPVCPYTALKYRHGLMQSLQTRAARQGVVWITIDTAAVGRPGYLTPQAARARIAAQSARVTAFVFDTDGRIGRAYGARVTPTVFIINTAGRLAYQGAIDDEPSLGSPGSGDHVSAALDDLRAGRSVRLAQTRPYGCAVEY